MSDSRDTRSKPLPQTREQLTAVCVGGTALAVAVWIVTMDARTLAMSVPDDACFYFKIGENLAAGRGPTFDGVHPTNGVQPLWQALVAATSWIGGPPDLRLRAGLLLGLATLIAGWAALSALLESVVSVFARVAACLTYLALALIPFTNGMESSILVALAVALGWLGRRYDVLESTGWKRPLAFGAVLGGVMLARLDAVFLGLTLCTALLWDGLAERQALGRVLARVTTVVVGASIVVTPYLVFNELVFGAAMPISGALKSSFPDARFALADLRSFGSQPVLLALVAVAHLGLARRLRVGAATNATRYLHVFAIALAGFVVIHFSHEALFMKWATYYWHFAAYTLYACIVAAFAADRVGRAIANQPVAARAASLLAGVGMLVLTARIVRTKPTNLEAATWHGVTYDAALWARAETSPDARFAMKDPGVFALFSERDVFSLDGLVNDLAFQEVLNRRELQQYLDDQRVDFLVQHAFYSVEVTEPSRGGSFDDYEVASMKYLSHLHGTWSEPITLRRSQEAHRSAPYLDDGQKTILAIWRWTGASPHEGTSHD